MEKNQNNINFLNCNSFTAYSLLVNFLPKQYT